MKKYSQEEIMKEIDKLEDYIFTMKQMREIFGGNMSTNIMNYSDDIKTIDEWLNILQKEYERKCKKAFKKFTGNNITGFPFK